MTGTASQRKPGPRTSSGGLCRGVVKHCSGGPQAVCPEGGLSHSAALLSWVLSPLSCCHVHTFGQAALQVRAEVPWSGCETCGPAGSCVGEPGAGRQGTMPWLASTPCQSSFSRGGLGAGSILALLPLRLQIEHEGLIFAVSLGYFNDRCSRNTFNFSGLFLASLS